MFHDLMGPIIGGMRRAAGFGVEELAEGIGKSPRTIERLEANDRKVMLKREQMEQLFDFTKTSKQTFGKIVAEQLGIYLGRTVLVLPADSLIPSLEILRAFKMFAQHGYKLDLEERVSIEDLLDVAKSADSTAESVCKAVARDVIRRINKARITLGEDPSKDDPED